MKKYPCPACGFLTISEENFGTYDVCRICSWEDDAVQLANPACGGGANGESLIEAQITTILEFPLGLIERDGYVRDPAWRPLNEGEIVKAQKERDEKYWKNEAIIKYSNSYWAN